jgi:hypothetical protein
VEFDEYLVKEYKERIAVLSDALASGGASSYDEYRYTCGQIRGLESACFVIADLKRQLEQSDND